MAGESNETRELEAACGELRFINNLITRICQVRETNHILRIIITELIDFAGADQGVINLVEPSEGSDHATVVRKTTSGADSLPFKLDALVSGRTLHEQTLIKIDDLDSDDRFPGLSSENGLFKSIVCCPMMVRGEAVGLLSLVRGPSRGPFGDDQCRVIGIAASQSAHVLSNALLAEQLAHKNDLLRLSQQQLRDENARLRSAVGDTFAFENIIARSDNMRQVLTLASQASGNDAPVLITGPTGTGKELIARAIHHESDRRGASFVVKNCGVKTESLLEAELFGYVKGAFTGADRDRPGLFREADGGTIFLDEIGDAPLPTQVAVLRAIETGEIRPVGATKTEHVDVRIISATNKDLDAEIRGGGFREDLYYRLNTFTIALPPLKDRRADIPFLVRHFLQKASVKLGRDALKISPEALEFLSGYSWPGNVRQLEHEVERAAIVCEEHDTITIADLSPSIRQVDLGAIARSSGGRLRDAVENLERELIRDALAENRGNILRTSEALGLTRKGLRDKMSRYGISATADDTAS
jgi:transcriptional regulator with GAF, ATPase, and Fis domain